MNIEHSDRPVLDIQAGNAAEVTTVPRDDHGPVLKGNGGDSKVHEADIQAKDFEMWSVRSSVFAGTSTPWRRSRLISEPVYSVPGSVHPGRFRQLFLRPLGLTSGHGPRLDHEFNPNEMLPSAQTKMSGPARWGWNATNRDCGLDQNLPLVRLVFFEA